MKADDVARLYEGFVNNNEEAVRSVLAIDAVVAIPDYEGPGVDTAIAAMKALHERSPGLRTWNDDSADVLVSEHHGVVLDRWLADGDRDAHVTVLAADAREDGSVGLFSIYGYSDEDVRMFWGGR